MSFSCECNDSGLGVVAEYEKPWTGHKTIKCLECGCELAPGHLVHTVITAEWLDEPFDEMEESRFQEVLDSDDTFCAHSCERCADLSEAIRDTGICYYFGGFWDGYLDWMRSRNLGIRAIPGRHAP